MVSRVVQYCPSLEKPCGVGEYTKKLAAALGQKAVTGLGDLKGEAFTHLHVQHEFSLIPFREMRRIVRFCRKNGLVLVVSMHTVLPIFPTWRIRVANIFLRLEIFFYGLKCLVSGPAAIPVPSVPKEPEPVKTGRSTVAQARGLYLRLVRSMHAGLVRFAEKGNPELDDDLLKMAPDSPVQDLILKQAHQIIVHNQSARNFLIRSGAAEERLTVFPLPVELLKTSEKLFSEDDGKRHVGCFGFLQPHKGILELIEACDRLPGTVLHLWTSTSNKWRRTDFERLVYAKVADRPWIRLSTEHLPLDQVVFGLSKCDVNVWYTLPLKTHLYASGSIREYLAAGRPIIASDIQAVEEIRDLVHPVPPGRPDLLAQALSADHRLPDGFRAYLVRHNWKNVGIDYVHETGKA